MDNLFLYFAYGSNLSTPRLKARTPSASVVGSALLDHHALRFNKRGSDGSAKCSFDPKAGEVLHGVLYRVQATERSILDRVEGVGCGYDALEVSVRIDSGESVKALTYRASDAYRTSHLPAWYRTHVLFGMMEHGFSPRMVHDTSIVDTVWDPNPLRRSKELAIYSEEQTQCLQTALAEITKQA